jgi:hypothetical protein
VIVKVEKEVNGIPLHTKSSVPNPGMFRRSSGGPQHKSSRPKVEKWRGAKKVYKEKFKRNPTSLRLKVRT